MGGMAAPGLRRGSPSQGVVDASGNPWSAGSKQAMRGVTLWLPEGPSARPHFDGRLGRCFLSEMRFCDVCLRHLRQEAAA